jgi:hypothetical protein
MHRDLDCFRSPTTIVDLTPAESPVNTSRLIRQVKFIGKKRRIRRAQTELSKKSLELGVFGLGLLEDGDIGVGVFP